MCSERSRMPFMPYDTRRAIQRCRDGTVFSFCTAYRMMRTALGHTLRTGALVSKDSWQAQCHPCSDKICTDLVCWPAGPAPWTLAYHATAMNVQIWSQHLKSSSMNMK